MLFNLNTEKELQDLKEEYVKGVLVQDRELKTLRLADDITEYREEIY